MNSNGLEILLKLVEKEQSKINEIKNEVAILPMGKRNNISLVDASRNKLTSEQTKKINEIEKGINDTIAYLNWCSTFDFNNLVSFIIDNINYNESILYSKADLYFNTNIADFNNHHIKTEQEHICLITDEETLLLVQGIHNENRIMDILESSNKKYIKLDYTSKYNLYDYDHLRVSKEIIEEFPYLSNIIEELIGFRLFNPKINEADLLSLVLNKTLNSQSSLVSNSNESSMENRL